MEKEINEYMVLIQGKTNVEGAIEDRDVILTVTASVCKVEDEDNQDGTFNRCYKLKPTSITCQPQ